MARQNHVHSNDKPIRLQLEFSDVTTEGVVKYAKTLIKYQIGNISFVIRELGSYIHGADSFQNRYLDRCKEYHDGIVTSKLTKGDDVDQNLEDIVFNALMYSDPTAFEKEIKAKYELMQQSGMTRRSVTSFNPIKEELCKTFTKAEKLAFNQKLDKYGDNLFEIFKLLPIQAQYELSDEAIDLLNNYEQYLVNQANANLDDTKLRKEIKSRKFKAEKLSCLFAILNHVQTLEITEQDVSQAIKTIEFLSQDYKKFLRYKPCKKDKYDYIFEWFKDHEGESFTTSELKKKYYKDFGYTRSKFKNDFDEIIENISEIAILEGYVFTETKLMRNGCKYCLSKPVEMPLSENVRDLNELIDDSDNNDNLSNPLEMLNDTNNNNLTNFPNNPTEVVSDETV